MLSFYYLSFILIIFLMRAHCTTFISSLNHKEISPDQILEEFTNLSITQCYLRCSKISKCKAIGMSADIKMGEKGYCYTLQKINSEVSKKGKRKMIVGKKIRDRIISCGNFLDNTLCTESDKADEGMCSISRNKLIFSFSHDKEKEIFSKGHEYNFDNISINYNFNLQCIKSVVMDESTKCFQRFYVEARGVSSDSVKFVTKNGIELKASEKYCLNCKSLFTNQNVISKGYANITETKFLPLKSVLISDTGDSHEYVKITLEKLICIKEY